MKRPPLSALALFCSFSFLILGSAHAASAHLLAKLKDGYKIPASAHLLSSRNLFQKVYVLHTNDVASLEKEMKSSGAFEYVERDLGNKRTNKLETPVPERLGPVLESEESELAPYFNDPRVSRQWTFKDATQFGISINRAYSEMRTSPREKILVAVVDTGVDFNHEDLKEVMWTNPDEIAGNGVDDDNNGIVDDVHGINTLKRGANGLPTGDMSDTHSHGTHVSGIIGAKQNNGLGIAGIASNIQIMGIRTVPNNGDELDVDVVDSYIYAAKKGAKLINCSFGKDRNEGGMAVRDAINFIGKEYGTLVVAAAGNDSSDIDRTLTYPASYDSATLLVVASTTSSGGLSYFSNYGIVGVDLAAPGSDILSSVPGGSYANMSGTSMATPTVVGVAAQVLATYPELGPNELKKVLMDSVVPVSRFKDIMVSGGRIDLVQALEKAAAVVANPQQP